jgi:DNA/RNA-binding domain of Phe-tRNA-synthetase-like protein
MGSLVILRAATFATTFPSALSDMPSPAWLMELLKLSAPAPFQPGEDLRTAVRDMLREGGYKPTGRGKPASEYLVRAAGEGALGTINAAVDACNVVSLHSGFPISVVDLGRAREPLHIAVAQAGEKYVFNSAGQEIDLAGLVCLYDADGPCGNAVKDSQRTKTDGGTKSTVSVIWGCQGYEDRLREVEAWYRSLLGKVGASCAQAAVPLRE